MGRRFGQRLTLRGMRKEGFSKQAVSNTVHIAYRWAETGLLKSTTTATRTAFENEISLYSEINNK